ncbi:MAG: hypothetical protein ACP5N2_03990 [Candidatus Nanoarchaeia archaeon]
MNAKTLCALIFLGTTSLSTELNAQNNLNCAPKPDSAKYEQSLRNSSPNFNRANFNTSFYKTMPADSIPTVSFPSSVSLDINFDSLSPAQAILIVETPKQVNKYNKKSNFSFADDVKNKDILTPSFYANYPNKKGLCFDYVINANALLSDNNHKPNAVILDHNIFTQQHALCLYKTPEGYGFLGYGSMDPIHPTVEDLIKEFNKMYNVKFSKYVIIDLDASFPNREWITGSVEIDLSSPYIPNNKWVKIKK